MKIDDRILEDARGILEDLKEYEDAVDIFSDNDVKVSFEFYRQHNHNLPYPKRVVIPIDKRDYPGIKLILEEGIQKIKQKLVECWKFQCWSTEEYLLDSRYSFDINNEILKFVSRIYF